MQGLSAKYEEEEAYWRRYGGERGAIPGIEASGVTLREMDQVSRRAG